MECSGQPIFCIVDGTIASQSVKVMDRFIQKGFYTIGALKTNQIIYACGIRQRASEFTFHLRKADPNVSLVTVGNREFYVYRYEGKLDDIPNAVVIFSYPKEAFGNRKVLGRFISMNVGVSTFRLSKLKELNECRDAKMNIVTKAKKL